MKWKGFAECLASLLSGFQNPHDDGFKAMELNKLVVSHGYIPLPAWSSSDPVRKFSGKTGEGCFWSSGMGFNLVTFAPGSQQHHPLPAALRVSMTNVTVSR